MTFDDPEPEDTEIRLTAGEMLASSELDSAEHVATLHGAVDFFKVGVTNLAKIPDWMEDGYRSAMREALGYIARSFAEEPDDDQPDDEF